MEYLNQDYVDYFFSALSFTLSDFANKLMELVEYRLTQFTEKTVSTEIFQRKLDDIEAHVMYITKYYLKREIFREVVLRLGSPAYHVICGTQIMCDLNISNTISINKTKCIVHMICDSG